MFHGAMLFQDVNDLRHARLLLTNGDIDTDQIFALLIDNRINRDGGLACLAVTDDQLALTTTNRDQGIDGGDTCLYRRIHRLALNNARSNTLDVTKCRSVNRALAI